MASLYYSDHDTIRAVKFGDISTDDLSENTLTAAEKQAYNFVNGALAGAYATPFAIFSTGNTPGLIMDISDILVMWIARRFTTGHSTRSLGSMKDLYDQAMEWLNMLRTRQLSLPGVTRKNAISSNTSTEHKVFASLEELDLVQDTGQVTRLENERD